MAACLAATFAASPVPAEDMPEGMVAVHYAFELDGWKPLAGESFCRIDQDCQLGFDFDPIRLTLRLASSGEDHLDIVCPHSRNGCSLGNFSDRVFSHQHSIETFSIYDGLGLGVSQELVLRYREKVGKVLLQYRVRRRPDFSHGECKPGQPFVQCPVPMGLPHVDRRWRDGKEFL